MSLLQLALDTLPIADATDLAHRLAATVDVIEAGTPMIKRDGMAAVRRLREAAPDRLLLADMKTMDGGSIEAEMALEVGADLVTVLGCAGDATVEAVVRTAHERGGRVVADLLGVRDAPGRAAELAALGVDFLGIHAGTDESAVGGTSAAERVAAVAGRVDTPLVVAGGITLASLESVLAYHPAIVVVGSAITSADDAVTAAAAFRVVIDAWAGSTS